MNKKGVFFLSLRYLILIILGVPNLYIFYLIFTPLTTYPVFWILNFLYDAVLFPGNVIFFKGYYASIIPACVAGAAYYLLLILNLTTPMKIKIRVKSLVFLFVTFLLLNILRIIIFALLLFKGYQYFDLTHAATWYFGSTILVILIWFSNVLIFRIKTIPIYTDIRNIMKDLKIRSIKSK
ncbi:MAG: pacearchaeosortase [Nanoarchaeota archaeon]|nr:pacearchaeosortase [Nanoarchaeota archaeon]